jgi:hypothetical protein
MEAKTTKGFSDSWRRGRNFMPHRDSKAVCTLRRHLSVTLDFDWLGLNAFGPDDLLHEITDHPRITTEFKLT